VELLVDTYIAIRIVAPSPGPHRHRHRRRPPALSAQRIAIAIYPGPEKKAVHPDRRQRRWEESARN